MNPESLPNVDGTSVRKHIAMSDTKQMTKIASKIRFKAKLRRPAESAKGDFWAFLTLPKNASAKLPSRSMTAIEGTINDVPFEAVLEPDGQKGHWLKVERKLSEAAGADAGDLVSLEIAPAAEEPEPTVPSDLQTALATAEPKAREVWEDITPITRRDWIQWITTAKQAETRTRRIKNTCSMLAAGKRRVCCFDRSGFYSKSLSAPKAAASTNSVCRVELNPNAFDRSRRAAPHIGPHMRWARCPDDRKTDLCVRGLPRRRGPGRGSRRRWRQTAS